MGVCCGRFRPNPGGLFWGDAECWFSLNTEYSLHFGDPIANLALLCAAPEFLRGWSYVPVEIGVDCERTSASEDQSGKTGEIEQAGLVAGRTETRARDGDGGELNGTESIRQMH